MTRQKKSRKPGPLAPRKVERSSVPRAVGAPKKEKGKGLPAGSRMAPQKNARMMNNDQVQVKDPRHGSKQPISLSIPQRKLPPEQEFAAIENDEKLQTLLARIEDGHILNKTEQAYVDSQLERYRVLATELGIDLDEGDEAEDDEHWEYDTSDMLDDDEADFDKF